MNETWVTNHKRQVIIGGSIAAVVLVIFVGWILISRHRAALSNSLGSLTNSTNTITGTMSLKDSAFGGLTSGTACTGSDAGSGYGDINQGAQVTVSNNSGSILALSSLDAGSADGSGNCVFNFTVQSVPYSSFYQIEVTHRGNVDYSYQQLSSQGFSMGMTLGN